MPSFDYSQFLTQAAADARYQAIGSLGSATPGTETPDHLGTAGISTSASRQDHVHPITCATPVAIGTALSEGVATTFARSDHVHTGPLGSMGYAQVTANQGGITAETDLTSLAVTFTAVAGRRYRITGKVDLSSTIANDQGILYLKDGATYFNYANVALPYVSNRMTVVAQAVTTLSAGPHTLILRAARIGTGTATMNADANGPCFILVEDIGV